MFGSVVYITGFGLGSVFIFWLGLMLQYNSGVWDEV